MSQLNSNSAIAPLALAHPTACYSEFNLMPVLSSASAFSRVTGLAAQRPIHAAFAWVHANPKTIMDWQVELVAIPAPAYGERERAEWLAQRFTEAGLSDVDLTMQAGAALRGELQLQGQAATLIAEHSHAAHILAIVYVVFTATLIVTFAAQRISGGMPTGLGIVDELLSPRPVGAALRVVLVLLAIGAGYMCFRTGDLGAKAVWQGRLQAAHAFPGR